MIGQRNHAGRKPSSNRGLATAGRPARGRIDLVMTIVAAAAVAAFLPILGNGFVERWDDQTNILQNPSFRGPGWPQIRWAWTTMLLGVYQPMAWMLLELEYVVWGLDPRGYHLASLAFHAVNAALLYALIRTLVSRALTVGDAARLSRVIPLISGLFAALFAVHPLRVEVVAWASCQSYLPCAGFAILSVLAYLRGCDRGTRRRRWLLASVLLYAASLGFKAVPVGLPLVLLILDRARPDRHGSSAAGVAAREGSLPDPRGRRGHHGDPCQRPRSVKYAARRSREDGGTAALPGLLQPVFRP